MSSLYGQSGNEEKLMNENNILSRHKGVYFGTQGRVLGIHSGSIKIIPFMKADWKCHKGNLHMFCYFHLLIHADRGVTISCQFIDKVDLKNCFQLNFQVNKCRTAKWEIITHNNKTLAFVELHYH